MAEANFDPRNPKHIRMVHMLLTGKTPTEIAKALNFDRVYISQLSRTEECRLYLSELQKDFSERVMTSVVESTCNLANQFDEEAPQAFETLAELHRDPNVGWSTRRAAAVDILEFAPSAPRRTTKTEQQTNTRTTITIEAPFVRDILQVAREVGDNDILKAAGVVDLPSESYTATPSTEPAVEAKIRQEEHDKQQLLEDLTQQSIQVRSLDDLIAQSGAD